MRNFRNNILRNNISKMIQTKHYFPKISNVWNVNGRENARYTKEIHPLKKSFNGFQKRVYKNDLIFKVLRS